MNYTNGIIDQLVDLGYELVWAKKQANLVAKAQKQMLKNVVRIHFYKKDGTFTTRMATSNPAFLPADATEIIPRQSCPQQIIFWSVEDGGYRSFLAENFIKVESPQSIGQLVATHLNMKKAS